MGSINLNYVITWWSYIILTPAVARSVNRYAITFKTNKKTSLIRAYITTQTCSHKTHHTPFQVPQGSILFRNIVSGHIRLTDRRCCSDRAGIELRDQTDKHRSSTSKYGVILNWPFDSILYIYLLVFIITSSKKS